MTVATKSFPNHQSCLPVPQVSARPRSRHGHVGPVACCAQGTEPLRGMRAEATRTMTPRSLTATRCGRGRTWESAPACTAHRRMSCKFIHTTILSKHTFVCLVLWTLDLASTLLLPEPESRESTASCEKQADGNNAYEGVKGKCVRGCESNNDNRLRGLVSYKIIRGECVLCRCMKCGG